MSQIVGEINMDHGQKGGTAAFGFLAAALITYGIYDTELFDVKKIIKDAECNIIKSTELQLLKEMKKEPSPFFHSIHGIMVTFYIKTVIDLKGVLPIPDYNCQPNDEMKLAEKKAEEKKCDELDEIIEELIQTIIRSLKKEINGKKNKKNCSSEYWWGEIETTKFLQKFGISDKEKALYALDALKNIVKDPSKWDDDDDDKKISDVETIMDVLKIIETIQTMIKNVTDIITNLDAEVLLKQLIKKNYQNDYKKGKRLHLDDPNAINYHDMCSVNFEKDENRLLGLGVPYGIWKSVNFLITKVKEPRGCPTDKTIKCKMPKLQNVSDIIRRLKLIPCYTILDALIKDILEPIIEEIDKTKEMNDLLEEHKKKIMQKIVKLLGKIPKKTKDPKSKIPEKDRGKVFLDSSCCLPWTDVAIFPGELKDAVVEKSEKIPKKKKYDKIKKKKTKEKAKKYISTLKEIQIREICNLDGGEDEIGENIKKFLKKEEPLEDLYEKSLIKYAKIACKNRDDQKLWEEKHDTRLNKSGVKLIKGKRKNNNEIGTKKKAKRELLKYEKIEQKKERINIKEYSRPAFKGGALIGQGTFGCVFKPHLLCNGKQDFKDRKHVSKLIVMRREDDYRLNNELEIGQLILKSNKYNKYFSPIISTCPINFKDIDDKDKYNCNSANKYMDNKMILAKLKKVNGTNMIDTIDNIRGTEAVYIFFDIYKDALEGIKFLTQKKIIHYDIKWDNLLYDTKVKRGILIDFGLSFQIKYLKFDSLKKLKKYFYVFAPQMDVWCIEIHYICYLLNINSNPDLYDITDMVNECISNNSLFKSEINRYFDLDKNTFYDNSISVLMNYQKDYPDILKRIKYIVNKFYKTWDNYSLSIMFLKQYDLILKEIPNKFPTFHKKIITDILWKNIQPNPKKRLTVKKTIKSFNKLYDNLNSTEFLELSKYA